MKKLIILLISILSFALLMFAPIHAADLDLVVDEVELLSQDELSELNELADNIVAKYQCEVSIVVIEDKGDEDVTELAKAIYKEYNYGYGDDKSGLMLLLSMEDRDYALIAYGSGNTAFTDHGKDVLMDRHLLPLLGNDEYYEGFTLFLNQADEYLEMAGNDNPFDLNTDEVLNNEKEESSFWIRLGVTIFVPLIIAGLVCFTFLRQMKTAVSQRAADVYIPDGGFDLTMQADNFLYVTEVRTQIPKESSSGGTSVGSDGSSSTSGKF